MTVAACCLQELDMLCLFGLRPLLVLKAIPLVGSHWRISALPLDAAELTFLATVDLDYYIFSPLNFLFGCFYLVIGCMRIRCCVAVCLS